MRSEGSCYECQILVAVGVAFGDPPPCKCWLEALRRGERWLPEGPRTERDSTEAGVDGAVLRSDRDEVDLDRLVDEIHFESWLLLDVEGEICMLATSSVFAKCERRNLEAAVSQLSATECKWDVRLRRKLCGRNQVRNMID